MHHIQSRRCPTAMHSFFVPLVTWNDELGATTSHHDGLTFLRSFLTDKIPIILYIDSEAEDAVHPPIGPGSGCSVSKEDHNHVWIWPKLETLSQNHASSGDGAVFEKVIMLYFWRGGTDIAKKKQARLLSCVLPITTSIIFSGPGPISPRDLRGNGCIHRELEILCRALEEMHCGKPDASRPPLHLTILLKAEAYIASQRQGSEARVEDQHLQSLPAALLSELAAQAVIHAVTVSKDEERTAPETLAVRGQGGVTSGDNLRLALKCKAYLGKAVEAMNNLSRGGCSRLLKGRVEEVSWQAAVLQAAVNKGKEACSLRDCEIDAEPIRAFDAIEDAVCFYKSSMPAFPCEPSGMNVLHRQSCAQACRHYMGLVLRIQNVGAVTKGYGTVKSRCEQEYQIILLCQPPKSRQQRQRASSRATSRAVSRAASRVMSRVTSGSDPDDDALHCIDQSKESPIRPRRVSLAAGTFKFRPASEDESDELKFLRLASVVSRQASRGSVVSRGGGSVASHQPSHATSSSHTRQGSIAHLPNVFCIQGQGQDPRTMQLDKAAISAKLLNLQNISRPLEKPMQHLPLIKRGTFKLPGLRKIINPPLVTSKASSAPLTLPQMGNQCDRASQRRLSSLQNSKSSLFQSKSAESPFSRTARQAASGGQCLNIFQKFPSRNVRVGPNGMLGAPSMKMSCMLGAPSMKMSGMLNDDLIGLVKTWDRQVAVTTEREFKGELKSRLVSLKC